MAMPSNLGMKVLAIYLIVIGVIGLYGASLTTLHFIVPLLALVAGILILLGK